LIENCNLPLPSKFLFGTSVLGPLLLGYTDSFYIFVLTYNLTHHRIFTSKIWTNGSRLLQESNLIARQPCRAPHHVIQATIRLTLQN